MQAVEAFQLDLTTLVEVDAGTGDEVVDDVGHQNLAAEGLAGDACRVVDCRAEEVVAFVERVACVSSDPDSNRRRDVSECADDRALDRLGTRNGSSCAREREHRSVALRLDDGAAVRHRCLIDEGVVASEEVEPCVVADAAEQDGRVHDVGEHDRHGPLGVDRVGEVRLLALDDRL